MSCGLLGYLLVGYFILGKSAGNGLGFGMEIAQGFHRGKRGAEVEDECASIHSHSLGVEGRFILVAEQEGYGFEFTSTLGQEAANATEIAEFVIQGTHTCNLFKQD